LQELERHGSVVHIDFRFDIEEVEDTSSDRRASGKRHSTGFLVKASPAAAVLLACAGPGQACRRFIIGSVQ